MPAGVGVGRSETHCFISLLASVEGKLSLVDGSISFFNRAKRETIERNR